MLYITATAIIILLILFLIPRPQSELDTLIQSINEDRIAYATLYSTALDDGFEIHKVESKTLYRTLRDNRVLKSMSHEKDYYYNKIVFYDEDDKVLLVAQCINPTGSKKNQEVIIGDKAYRVKGFYKTLYDIGEKEDYYLRFNKF